jgi:C2H2 type zinc finger protein
MAKHVCDKCEASFARKEGLTYHAENDVCAVKKFKCKYCPKSYTTETSKYRHIRQKHEEEIEEDRRNKTLEEQVKMLIQENQNLKSRVTKMEKKQKPSTQFVNNSGVINHGTINDNRTINNITIVAYGKEDMSHIDREDIIKALKTGFNSTKHLTEVVHFNPKYPNYSNIKRNNFNMKNKLMYHNGKGWVTTSDPHMIDELYYRKRDFIEENIEHYRDGLTKGDMTRLQRWLNVDDDDQRITKIKGDLREMLFNKKEVAEINEQQSDITYVHIEDLDDKIDEQINNMVLAQTDTPIIIKKTVRVKKRNTCAGRPGTKRKYCKIVRNN